MTDTRLPPYRSGSVRRSLDANSQPGFRRSPGGTRPPGRLGQRAWHRSRLALVALLSMAPALLPGCSCEEEKKAAPTPSAVQTVSLAPVPAPSGRVADVFVPRPEETWTALRALAGPRAALLPASYALMVTTLLGLPPIVASRFDPGVPTTGLLMQGKDGKPQVVLAFHVRSGREFLAALTTGQKPRFRSKPEGSQGLLYLEPLPGKAAKGIELGVVGNYLVVSTEREVLISGGPYAARTLPKQPMPKEAVVAVFDEAALKGPVAARIRKAWMARRTQLEADDQKKRAEKGGRAPDFGDPAAALVAIGGAVDDMVAVIEDSKQARLVIQPGKDHLEAWFEIDPKPVGAAAKLIDGMPVGDLSALRKMPGATSLALLSRGDLAERQKSVDGMVKSFVRLFGERFPEADQKQVRAALELLAQGRGDWTVVGFGSPGGKVGLSLVSPATDKVAFDKGARAGLEALKLRAFAEPLRQFVGETKLTFDKTPIEGVTEPVQRGRLKVLKKREVKQGISIKPFTADFLWLEQEGTIYGVAGLAAPESLQALLQAAKDPKTSMNADRDFVAASTRAGSQVGFALTFQPGKFSRKTAQSPDSRAPVLISLSREGKQGRLRLDAAKGAVQSLIRMYTGF